jgi:hypothetical protein
MFIALLTLISALSISGVAIFYSVIGLATIFPGAFVPVVIMGSVLEVGKLIAASWLYRNWKQTRFLLKFYLATAVVVLSLITSMGIFGFLSKAHLEQNLAENTVVQRIEIINNKIESEETYIKRQKAIIERAEKSLSRTSTTNDEAISIEKENLKAVEDKFKTLLAVETKNIETLSNRMMVLDKDVSDVLTSNKSFFNEEKAAKQLKDSQKEERADINIKISESQSRIAQLKLDYANDTAVIQKRIEKLREGGVDDKSGVYAQIEVSEENILKAQNNIDDLIIDREPLEAKMIKLEAEIGPVKYIAALVVDWGVTKDVDTNEAVRWVILIIICVFDPLAVALLLAANQSLMRRFPAGWESPEDPTPPSKPKEPELPPKKPSGTTIKASDLVKSDNSQLAKDQQSMLDSIDKNSPSAQIEEIKIEEEPSVSELLQEGMKKQIEAEEKEEAEQEAKEQREDELLDELIDDEYKGDGFDEDQIKYDMETEPKPTPIPIPTTAEVILPERNIATKELIDEYNVEKELKEELIKIGEDKETEVLRTLDAEEQKRLTTYDEKESSWQSEKAEWKRRNPEDTIKRHKELYVKGFIDKLPWEDINLEKPEDLESWNKWVDAANKEAEKEDSDLEKKRLTNL